MRNECFVMNLCPSDLKKKFTGVILRSGGAGADQVYYKLNRIFSVSEINK